MSTPNANSAGSNELRVATSVDFPEEMLPSMEMVRYGFLLGEGGDSFCGDEVG